MEVTIYIATTLKDPRRGLGRYGYVIECMKDGKPVTREGFGGHEDTTESALTLQAIAEALEKLTRPCMVKILTSCSAVKVGIGKGWVYEWQKAGWKTQKGSEVKNAEIWQRVLKAASTHMISIPEEPNPYEAWIESEMAKRE